MADWSDLPTQLLDLIAEKLLAPGKFFFTAVCTSWRSTGAETLHNVRHQLYLCPRLVIQGETKESQTRNCVEPVEGDDGYITYSHNNKPSKQLPVPHQSYVCGSSLGWVVLIDDNFDTQLFNPVTMQKFDLPSSKILPPAKEIFPEYFKYYVDKAIILIDPTSSTPPQTTVLLLCHGASPCLKFCKLGDKEWTPIVVAPISEFYFHDAIYYRDKFYAVRGPGHCDVVDIDHQTLIPYVEKPNEEAYPCPRYTYLVECEKQLFLVVRTVRLDCQNDSDNEGRICHHEIWENCMRRYSSVDFRVYKLEEESEGTGNWIKVENIGENAFFVGYNSSFSLSTTDQLGYKTCKPNSIYFTDDENPFEFTLDPIRHDIGIFRLDSKAIESIFPAETDVTRPPPFWFTLKLT